MTLPQYEGEPTEKRAARIQGAAATAGGVVNTNVLAFTGVPAAHNGTLYPPGTTHTAPASGSGSWINIVNSANHGTTFKFLRKGIYTATLMADAVAAYAAGANVAITLDQAVGLYTVGGAGAVSTAISDTVLQYWTQIDTVADVSFPLVLSAEVYITDALAAGAQPADAAGVQGVGVLRFTVNDNAAGVVSTAFVVASYRAVIQTGNDQAG